MYLYSLSCVLMSHDSYWCHIFSPHLTDFLSRLLILILPLADLQLFGDNLKGGSYM